MCVPAELGAVARAEGAGAVLYPAPVADSVRIVFLGGLGEIGRNCFCIEVDCNFQQHSTKSYIVSGLSHFAGARGFLSEVIGFQHILLF